MPRPPSMEQGHSNDFQSPPYILEFLYPYLKKEWTIWEPSCGKGNLVKEFETKGYKVVGTDILTGQDFLTYEPDNYDCIITNPPFSIKQKFLERCYSLRKPFALLLPLTTFETKKRQDLFRSYGLEVIFLPNRVNFETPSGRGSGAWFASCWITNWLNIGKQMTFSNLDGLEI